MEYSLEVTPRTILGRKVKQLRQKGLIPGVVYGNHTEVKHVSISGKVFHKLYHEAGTSTLVNLKIDDEKPIKVLIKEPQIHPTSSEPLAVDFYQVNMKEKIRTEVPLEFVGESPAVVDQEGKLVTSLDAVEIECLPDDLVQHFQIDVSVLANFDDAIHVSDIKAPEGIEILTDAELTIVVVQAPLTEEQLEAELAEETSEEEAIAAVEVEEKGESEEGAEGEAPAESAQSEKEE